MTTEEILDLKNKGYVILRNKVSSEWINKLCVAVDNSFSKHKEIQKLNNNEIKTTPRACHPNAQRLSGIW